MSKYVGNVGFVKQEPNAPGSDVWVDKLVVKRYHGDVIRATRKWENSENLNKNFTIRNNISIVADPFAFKNFGFIRYVEWEGVKWEVTCVEVKRPRLILTIGGVYNA